MADTYTSIYSFTKPEVGASATTWGNKLNANLDDLDADLNTLQVAINARLQLAGGTMTGALVLSGAPTVDLHPATKLYVDTADALKAALASPTFTGTASFARARTAPVAVAIAAGVLTIDCALSNVFTVAMDQNITSIVMSNVSSGQSISVRFTQDGTGSRTWVLPASFLFAGGSNPALSTAINTVDELVASYYGDTAVWSCSLTKALA